MEEQQNLSGELERDIQGKAESAVHAGLEFTKRKAMNVSGAAVGNSVAPGVGTVIGTGIDVVAKYIVAVFMVLILFLGSLLGAIGAGRENELRAAGYAETTLPLSEQVLAYKEMVEAAAEKYGSKEYVPLFLAVMMQESGGRAVDVFQCAESLGYGPQGLTGTAISTETSIDHGVYLLTQRLLSAGAESPIDRQNISLAIQSYNMGGGFISFAVDGYGGYSLQAALDYQELQSHPMQE